MLILTEFLPRENVNNFHFSYCALFYLLIGKVRSEIAALVGIRQVSYPAGIDRRSCIP